jgi:F-type H+-transporting ATPase subunit a
MDAGNSNTFKKFFFFLLIALNPFLSFAQEPADHPVSAQHEEGKFRAGDMILHHVGDSPEWHFATVGHSHWTLPLPVILYVPGQGLETFSSSRFHNETRAYGDYKLDEHDHIRSLSGKKFYNFSITRTLLRYY